MTHERAARVALERATFGSGMEAEQHGYQALLFTFSVSGTGE